MTKDQLEKAAKDQIIKFFNSYYTSWRLNKILTIDKLLKTKYEFYYDIIEETKREDDDVGTSTISQEITNGLGFDAISNCIQFIEDLFAMINATKNRSYFIKEIITYDAGKIENIIINFKINDKNICKAFHFPFEEESEDDNNSAWIAYKKGLMILGNRIEKIISFYIKHKFMYNQYKHGLTVALRPYVKYNEDQINNDRENPTDFYLAAFDNLSLQKALNNKYKPKDYIFMPCLTENTKPFLDQLQNEDNLLRLVIGSPESSIESIKQIAYITRGCLHVLINNFMATYKADEFINLQLPEEGEKVIEFKFPIEYIRKKA